MKNKKVLLGLLIIVLVLASVLTFLLTRSNATDNSNSNNLPGKVIGPNPQNIPEDQLPVCNFTGANFVEQPCYSPPGSIYM